MNETNSKRDNSRPEDNGFFKACNSIEAFSETVKNVTGQSLDVQPLLELTTDFIQVSDTYMLLNLKEYGSPTPNNLLLLTKDAVYACSERYPSREEISAFEDVLVKPFGRSTIVTFLFFDRILEKHKQYFDSIVKKIGNLEQNFLHNDYRDLLLDFERFSDRLEEFHDLILELQERRYKQIETQYITFDYRVLITESQSLQGRCRRRQTTLKDVRQDHELKATEDLNNRIIRLNDVVKKLTSITVILMLPTLIASHFGMNFQFMPELHIRWVYPAVIGAQLVIIGVFFAIFRKIGWL